MTIYQIRFVVFGLLLMENKRRMQQKLIDRTRLIMP